MLVNCEQIYSNNKSIKMKETAKIGETAEFQTTSLDSKERKLVRRLRIQRRLQKAQQQQHIDVCQEPGDVDNKTMLEKQLESSENQLEKLLLEGKELVTNVRIATDAREVNRRKDEVAAKEKRLKRLEDQARESAEKFNEVNSRWKVILESSDPLDLHHNIEEQRVKCAELIAQKDKLIKELREELKLADDIFDKDQEKQKEDLWLLAERIDNQVKMMRNVYKDELKLIEEVIELEQNELMKVSNSKWEALYKEHEKLEIKHMEKKFQAVNRHEDEICRISVEHHEKFREVKIKLQTDIQVLQQELQIVKTQCFMNSVKLDYNLQVLKKREEENLIVRAQQKRRINRLQDVVNDLKKKIAATEKSTKTESTRLTEEVERLHHNIFDIEGKADHFAEMNDRKYQQVWNLNRDTAKKLLDKILDIDRILHEQQLGLEWTCPDLCLLYQEDLSSHCSAMQVVADMSPKKDAHDTESKARPIGFPMTKEVETVHAEDISVWRILKLVADNSDFLAEKQLKDLLEPYTDKEKMLVKIDSVFTILGVNTEAEILMLKKCFLPYAKCSVCSTPQEERVTTIFKGSHASLGSTSTPGNTDTAVAGLVPDTNIKFGVESAEEDEQLHDMDITATEVTCTPPTSIADITDKLHFIHSKPDCPDTHSLVIDPVFVLKVLRDFVTKFSAEEYRHLTNLTSSFSAKHGTLCRLISTQDVTTFWTKFREIFSPQREKLWDGLLIGLQRYHCILEDRHKLNVKTEKLRQQNADLRRLLHFYIQNPENESTFLSSWERLKPISGNGLHGKSKIKFARATTSIGRKST